MQNYFVGCNIQNFQSLAVVNRVGDFGAVRRPGKIPFGGFARGPQVGGRAAGKTRRGQSIDAGTKNAGCPAVAVIIIITVNKLLTVRGNDNAGDRRGTLAVIGNHGKIPVTPHFNPPLAEKK